MIANEDNQDIFDFINQPDDEINVIPEEETEEEEVEEVEETKPPEFVEEIVDLELGKDYEIYSTKDKPLSEMDAMQKFFESAYPDIVYQETPDDLSKSRLAEKLDLRAKQNIYGDQMGANVWYNQQISGYYNRDTGLFKLDKMDDPKAVSQAAHYNNMVADYAGMMTRNNLNPKLTTIAGPGEEVEAEGKTWKYDIIEGEDGFGLGYYIKDKKNNTWELTEGDSWDERAAIYGIFDHDKLMDPKNQFNLEDVRYFQQDEKRTNVIVSLYPIPESKNNILGGPPIHDIQMLPNKVIRAQGITQYKDAAGNIKSIPIMTEDIDYTYTGEYQDDARDLLLQNGFPEDTTPTILDIFSYALNGKDTPFEGGLEAIGVDLPFFLEYLKNSKVDLNQVTDDYFQATVENGGDTELKIMWEKQMYSHLFGFGEERKGYFQEQNTRLQNFLLTNYLANQLNTEEGKDKFGALVEQQNKLAEESIYDFSKFTYKDWVNNPVLQKAVADSLMEELDTDDENVMLHYIQASMYSTGSLYSGAFVDTVFNNFDKWRNDKAERGREKYEEALEEGATFGQWAEQTWFGTLGVGKRILDHTVAAADLLSPLITSWTTWDGPVSRADWIKEAYETEDRVEILPQGTTGKSLNPLKGFRDTGKIATVEIDGEMVRFIQDPDTGQIFNMDLKIAYFPEVSPGGTEEQLKIYKALEESEEIGSMGSWKGFSSRMVGIGAQLAWDIGMMVATKNLANKKGWTKKYQTWLGKNKFINNKNSVFNPKNISLASNTAIYYGTTFALDGYNDAYRGAVANGMSDNTAYWAAIQAASAHGTVGALTSIFVPSNMLMQIPKQFSRFSNASKGYINALKNGGPQAAKGFLRNYYSNMSLTNKAVLNRIYNGAKGLAGELGQELSQQAMGEEVVNRFINNQVGVRFLDQDFTAGEAFNVALYASAAGGAVGMIANPDSIYDNHDVYNMNLWTLAKDPARFKKILAMMVADNNIDQAMADQAIKEVMAMKDFGNKIPRFLKSKAIVPYALLMQEDDRLEKLKKKAKGDKAKEEIDKKIDANNEKINILFATNINQSSSELMASLGQEFYSLKDTDAVKAFIDKLKKENPNKKITNDASDYGNFITLYDFDSDGNIIPDTERTIAIVNEDAAAKGGQFLTGQHEAFHGFLWGVARKHLENVKKWELGGMKGDKPVSPIAQMGNSVLNYLTTTEGVEFFNVKTKRWNNNPRFSELNLRFKQYLADAARGKLDDKTVLEEVLPLLSEALTKGMIKLPETTLGKLSDIFRRAFAAVGWNFAITEGKDVINLIRDFNLAIESPGGLSRGLKNIGEGKGSFGVGDTNINLDSEGTLSPKLQRQGKKQMLNEDALVELEEMLGELGLIPGANVGTEANIEGEDDVKDNKASKKLTDLVVDYKNLLQTDPNAEPSKELLGQYTAASLAALYNWGSKRKPNPVPFRQTFYQGNQLSEQGREGLSMIRSQLADIVRTYKPEVNGKPIAFTTYLDQTIGPRIGTKLVEEYARKTQQTSTEVLQEKGFSPQTDTQKDFDAAEVQSTARPKVFPNKIKTISQNITGETRADQMVMLKNDITEGILRVGPKPKEIAKYIVEKTKSKEYRKIIKDKLGVFGSKQYIDNVNALFANTDFISSMPVANIKRRFGKLFGIKQTGTTPTIKVEEGKETRYDKGVYNIPEITDAKLKRIRNYFLEGEKRSQSLYSMIGEGIAVEAIEELRSDSEFMNELQNRLSFKNSNIDANQFMSELNFDLDKRNLEDTSLDNVKASKKFNVSQAFLNDFAKIVLDKDINEVLSNLTIDNKKLNTTEGLRGAQGDVQSVIEVTGMSRNMFESFALKQAGAVRVNPYLATTKLSKGETLSSEAFQKLSRFNRWNKGKKVTDDYYYELNDGSWVKGDKVGKNSWAPPEAEWNNIKPGRGRLYWGENDPAYTSAEAATTEGGIKVMRVSRTGKKLVVNQDFMEGKVQDGRTRNEVFDDNMKALVQTIRFLNKAINEGVTVKDINGKIIKDNDGKPILQQVPLSTAALLIKLSYQATTGLIKVASKFKYYHKDLKPGQETREEHNPPASVIGAVILLGLKQNQPEAVIDWIKKNYWQSQIPISEDNKINKAKLAETLPEFTTFETNTAVRLVKSGDFNLDKLVSNEKGKKKRTLAQELKFPLEVEENANNLETRNRLLAEVLLKKDIEGNDINKTIRQAKNELKSAANINNQASKQVNFNADNLFDLLLKNTTTEESIISMANADETIKRGNTYVKASKGISVFDFDDTLAFSDSKVIVEMPNNTIKQITPAEFARTAEDLQNQGAEFNFDQFNKVINGRKGPLADLALKRQAKFGSGDIFILTARPQASATAIKLFLDGIGLEIPLKNITGLENGSPEAKALWVLDKTKEGYNDFYFADDALPNVQAVKNILDQIDVKSDVQQAKASKKTDLDKDFNVIIEQQSGKEWYKTYSKARAQVEGRRKNQFEFFIPPSAEDFVGLLYKLLPKGEEGNLALQWIQDNLVDPFNKGEQLIIQAKMAVANDFKALKEGLDNIPSNLMEQVGYSNFTWSQALRVYVWNMQDMEIPGLSSRDKNALVKLIAENPDLKVFAEKIAFIQKNKPYPAPKTDWVSGSITSDILNGIEKVYRKEALQEFLQNTDIIFSDKNMAKLEALYGKNWILALKNILGRMKRGSNRPISSNAQVDDVIDWLNASVGTTMFLNRKSALLQLISNVNFINWTDNNVFEAGKAFANQKQYWTDVIYLLNSDYLTQRRNGLKINVAESEIAEAAKKGGFKGAVAYLLNKGFIFTRIADSLAIATGGATFYRNRVNRLQKTVNIDTGKLYTKAEAESKAFNDFYKISEETQQSSRTDRISMQQASGLGRLVLNYANTPMQYSRIIKKSTLDLLNGRGDWRSNVSKILYYGLVQNLIFTAMQQALFAVAFVEDDDDLAKRHDDKSDLAFSLLSNLLRGLGYGGALVDTLIQVSREINTQSKKKSPDYEEAVWKIFDFSPSVDTKVRKIRSAANTWKYNRKEIERRGFSLENPAYLAVGQIVSAGVNVPLDRALRMSMAIKQISDTETAMWQKFALAMGYTSWSVGLPYWGTLTTIANEGKEDDQIKTKYKNDARKLKGMGYKRIPMTKGKPSGEIMEDYIEVTRPSGDTEYWLTPKK